MTAFFMAGVFNVKCKMKNVKFEHTFLHFTFCILIFVYP